MRHPARRDGNGCDILVHAMQRNDRRQNDQRQIHAHEVPVVVHQRVMRKNQSIYCTVARKPEIWME